METGFTCPGDLGAILTYSEILRFYLPLVITSQMMTLSVPLINLGLGRTADPGLALASAKPEKKKGGGESYIQVQAVTASTNATGGRRGILH